MTILCYHAVQPGWSGPMAMEPGAFGSHCEWLARRRTVVPLQVAVDRLDRHGRLPRGMSALTFDDGFDGLQEHAARVLTRHGLPATVFLVAQTLCAQGQRVDWVDDPPREPLATLTLAQVLQMQSEGIAFESHSYAHLDLTTLSFEDCVRDLRESREFLESVLGRRVRLLAYPRGRHSASVRAAAERAGYSFAFTLPEGREPVGPYSVPRVGIYRGNGLGALRAKSASPYLSLRTSSAYVAARAARNRLRGDLR